MDTVFGQDNVKEHDSVSDDSSLARVSDSSHLRSRVTNHIKEEQKRIARLKRLKELQKETNAEAQLLLQQVRGQVIAKRRKNDCE